MAILSVRPSVRRPSVRDAPVSDENGLTFVAKLHPPAHSPTRELNSVTRKRRRIRLRTSHIPITILYTLQLLLGSPRTRISLRGGRTGHRPSAQLVTNRYLNMVTNLHIAGPKPSRVGPPLRTRSRAIPI